MATVAPAVQECNENLTDCNVCMTFGAEEALHSYVSHARPVLHTCVTLRRTTGAISAFRDCNETGASPATWVLTRAPREVEPKRRPEVCAVRLARRPGPVRESLFQRGDEPERGAIGRRGMSLGPRQVGS